MKIPILLAALTAFGWALSSDVAAQDQPAGSERADQGQDAERSSRSSQPPDAARRDGDRPHGDRDQQSRRSGGEDRPADDVGRRNRGQPRQGRSPRDRGRDAGDDARRRDDDRRRFDGERGRREDGRRRGDDGRRRGDDSRRDDDRRGDRDRHRDRDRDDGDQWFDPDWWYENPGRPDRGRRDRDRDRGRRFDPDWWYEYPGDRDRSYWRDRRDWRSRRWGWDRRGWQDRRAVLGVGVNDRPGRGVTVSRVIARSPADQAGLQPGDRILTVDREAVFDREDLSRILSRHDPGDHVRIYVRRDGRRLRLSAELEPRSQLY